MKNKLTNKIISVTLVLSMILSFCGVMPAFAAIDTSDTPSDNRAKLSMAYLGTGAMPEQEAQEIDTSSWAVGQKFWVGIYISNVKTMDAAITPALDTAATRKTLFTIGTGDSIATGGITDIKAGVNYASDYIEPADEYPDDTSLTGQDAFQQMSTDALLTMPIWEDFTQYAASGSDHGDDILDHASVETVTLDNPKTAAVGIESSNVTKRVWRAKDSVSDEPLYLFVAQFKVKAIPPKGTKVISVARNANQFVLQTGNNGERFGGQWNKDRSITPEENLKNFFDYTGDLDLFPASANRKLQSIAVKDPAYALPQQTDEAALNVGSLALTATYNEDPITADADMSKVTYGYADTDSVTDSANLTAVPAKLSSTLNGKYLYAIYTDTKVTKIVKVGQLNVPAKSLSSISIESESKFGNFTGNTDSTTYYTTTNILNSVAAKKLTVKKHYDNSTDSDPIAFAAYGTNGLALYKVDTDSKLQTIGQNDTFTAGTNTFYVAEAGKEGTAATDVTIKSEAITVTAVADTMAIDSVVTAPKLKYATAEDTTGDKRNVIDFSGLKLKTYSVSNPDSKADQTLAEIGADNLIFYIGDTDAVADNAYASGKTEITSGTTPYTTELKNKYVFVVPKANTSATPVLVGQLQDRAMVAPATIGGTINGVSAAATYGDKLGDAMNLTVTYDNGDTKTISYNDFGSDITIKIDGVTDPVTKDTVLTPAMTGKKVEFYNGSTKLVGSAELTVNKKVVDYAVDGTPEIAKAYDGKTDLPQGTTLTLKLKSSDLLTDDAALADKLVVNGVDFKYNTKDVKTANAVVANKSQAGLSVAKSATGADADVTAFNANYTLKDLAADTTIYNAENKVKINPVALTLNANVITVDPVMVGTTGEALKGEKTLTLSNTNSNLVAGDIVTLPYSYEYPADKVATAGDVDVTVALKDLTGADKDNYTFDKTQVTSVKGKVSQDALTGITVEGPDPIEYTYPNLTPDLSKLVVKPVHGSTTGAAVTNYTLTKADGTEFDKTAALPYGDTEVTVSYTEGGVTKTGKFTLTAKKKPIKLSEITFGASKVYGSDTVNATVTLPTDAIAAADAGKVKLTYKAEFEKPEQVGENKKVTFSEIKFAKDGEGTEDLSTNYVLVEDNGEEIAADKVVETTGTITQGEQTAPAAPTVNVDQNTNNIVVSGPLGDTIEYSINGTDWQTGTTFTGLEKGKKYTVSARYKATENLAASPASTTDATTFKNHLVVYKVNTSTSPLAEIYTNETTATNDNDINTKILTSAPSKFKAYFTDLAGKTAIAYPFTLSTETTLYMTQKTIGGGGGGGSTVSIKLDKETVSGVVGDKIQVVATVTGSTTKPKWTSSDEKVATVDENGNIVLVGKGTATVKVNVNGTVKNITVNAEEAKATPTPVPTTKPTEAPVINTEYTKPYASGYDDGSFQPNNNITRAELAAMIARLSYGDDLPDGMYQASFPDVDSDAWFNKYIGYLEDKDVLSGYEDGTFRPMDTITRGEISAVIARAQRYDLISYNDIFTDVTENDWAKDYIETLADKNIVSGYEDSTFGPYSPLTRAEAVAIINRVLVQSTPIITFTPNDITGHWAEADILLAVNERIVGANAEVPTVTPEVIPEETVTPEETTVPEETVAPEETPAA